MTASEQMLALVEGSKNLRRLCREYETESVTVHLKELVGGAFSLYAAATIRRTGGVHVFVAEDRDAAAYLLNDLYALLDERRILFFPSSYKRSIVYGAEDAQGVVQRTAALNALRTPPAGYLALCTYPEALAERVVDAEALRRETMTVRAGDRLRPADLVEWLDESGFVRVDFVYEPGQYSQRGGIVDVFSYVESLPYRFDFFDEEVDSIRRFNISSQLSQDKLQQAEIIPNLNAREGGRVSLVEAAGDVCYWFFDADYALRRVDDLRRRMLAEADDPAGVDRALTSRRQLLDALAGKRLFAARDTLAERPATVAVEFRTAPQPSFNKNFELLADDLSAAIQKGYRTYILSENKAQVERLQNIFHQVGRGGVVFTPVSLTLHEGFVDHTLRLCCYTDHQLFDRYQRYRINGEIRRDEQMTVAELNQLKPGDYVVHIDHGVGRFGGLVKINENGRTHEAIKLVYRDGDVLFVNVHSLHRISRYKSGDGEPPKVYKLGSGAWQKLKAATKKAVKDISRELIALYAKRKASQGFAFSADGYLQHELEASFRYEETPDQQAAIEAVKRDMESAEPMDRLVCGDVGFGKTEVALRAVMKCVLSGKQCAILVPTTVLAMQHFQTALRRFEHFPVNVEMLSRFVPLRKQREVLAGLKSGKVDVVIGTHRLVQKDVAFHALGLAIVDEEQRFGVAHKEKFKEMFAGVDMLTLSATPIPRTLNMAMSGIRDMSVIAQPPQDRYPVQTYVMEYNDAVVFQAIRRELKRGGQVYYIYNRVNSIELVAAKLQSAIPEARILVAHGRMGEAEMSEIWRKLVENEADILVCTTIIETGVDVPNVNTLIIENADYFGLSQLYQLRGRVGRSNRRAYAYFTFKRDKVLREESARRLAAMREFTQFGSGFQIALRDLEIRGAGSMLGGQQHGHMEAVGYEMYLRLLEEAVAEAKGEPIPEKPECVVDIHIDAYIPSAYIESLNQRLDMYRKIAVVSSESEESDLLDELIDRYGEPPRQVLGLVTVARLRNTAANLGITEIVQRGGKVTFCTEQITPDIIAAFSAQYRGNVSWNLSGKTGICVTMERGTALDLIRDVLETMTKVRRIGK